MLLRQLDNKYYLDYDTTTLSLTGGKLKVNLEAFGFTLGDEALTSAYITSTSIVDYDYTTSNAVRSIIEGYDYNTYWTSNIFPENYNNNIQYGENRVYKDRMSYTEITTIHEIPAHIGTTGAIPVLDTRLVGGGTGAYM